MPYEFDIRTGQYKDTDGVSYKYTDPSSPHTKMDSNVLSVSDALLIAKMGLETINVKIMGEVSELSNKRGYKAVYFTIKDRKSALPCLM